jgi:hypothetical protein
MIFRPRIINLKKEDFFDLLSDKAFNFYNGLPATEQIECYYHHSNSNIYYNNILLESMCDGVPFDRKSKRFILGVFYADNEIVEGSIYLDKETGLVNFEEPENFYSSALIKNKNDDLINLDNSINDFILKLEKK